MSIALLEYLCFGLHISRDIQTIFIRSTKKWRSQIWCLNIWTVANESLNSFPSSTFFAWIENKRTQNPAFISWFSIFFQVFLISCSIKDYSLKFLCIWQGFRFLCLLKVSCSVNRIDFVPSNLSLSLEGRVSNCIIVSIALVVIWWF